MTAPANRISGADIVVPAARPVPTPVAAPLVDIDVVLHRVREMLEGCGTTNRNDLLTIAIEALIEAGVDTRPRIVGTAQSLGFKPTHAGAMLGRGRQWRRGPDGTYRLVER